MSLKIEGDLDIGVKGGSYPQYIVNPIGLKEIDRITRSGKTIVTAITWIHPDQLCDASAVVPRFIYEPSSGNESQVAKVVVKGPIGEDEVLRKGRAMDPMRLSRAQRSQVMGS